MRRSEARTVLAVTACLLAFPPCAGTQGTDLRPAYILGPVQPVALITDFSRETAGVWKPASGSNVTYSIRDHYSLPGVATSLLRANVGRKDPRDREPGHNWFTLTRDGLPPGIVPSDADGFRFLLGSGSEVQWWISVELTAGDGATYSHVIADHAFPAGRILDYTVPLSGFRSHDGAALTPSKAHTLRRIAFVLSSPGAALLLDRVAAYRREKLKWWLDFSTSHPSNNLFQRTDPVVLVFTEGGARPAGASGFRYDVRDFFDRVSAHGIVAYTAAGRYTVPATPRIDGYYEVRAFPIDAKGRDVERTSRIRAEGTVPDGLGTFAVLPSTREENVARSRKLGTSAFFGLHGDFLGLADYVGLTWRFEYTGWSYLEPSKPDRSSGMAPWARERMREAPMPAYRLHILPFRANLSGEVPQWARSRSTKPPPFKSWDDYLAMVRDSVRVEKRLYPHMRHRIYGGAWEINLNMPPYVSQTPEYTPADIAELFRRFRRVVKAEDPAALVIGPCPSVIDPDWFERVIKGGVLRYLDGIETHGYNEGVFTPEENGFPAKIAQLNALVRHYKGRPLAIYCTEAGQPGVLGADVVYRSQAERMVRAAVIMKGEGVRVFLPFYGIDYERAGYWGFMFNRDIDSPAGPWVTRRVSPKPLVSAVAACVQILEGAAPEGRITTLSRGIWGYRFRKVGKRIAAVWTPGPARTVRLPVGRARWVEVLDIMGHPSRRKPRRGILTLTVSETPRYVVIAGPIH